MNLTFEKIDVSQEHCSFLPEGSDDFCPEPAVYRVGEDQGGSFETSHDHQWWFTWHAVSCETHKRTWEAAQ